MQRPLTLWLAVVGAVALAVAPMPLSAGPAPAPAQQQNAQQAPADPVALRARALRTLQDHPGDRQALALLGRIYQAFRAGGVTRAQEAQLRASEVADYQVALKAYPDWPEALYRSAVHRIALHRLEPQRVEELTKAIAELNRAATLLQSMSPSLLASVLHQRGRAEKHLADDILTKAGDAHEAERYYQQSLASFEAALALVPDRVDVLGEVVLVERGRGRSATALTRLEAAVPSVTKPAYRAKLWEMIGALRTELGHDSAGEALQQSLAANPNGLGAYLTLAAWHKRRGEPGQAEQVLNQAVAVIPDAIEAWQSLAEMAAGKGDPAAAARYRQNLMAVAPAKAGFIGMQPSRNLYRNSVYRAAALALAEDTWQRLQDRTLALKWLAKADQFGLPDAQGKALAESLGAKQ
jgi:tetratricopeptide (TPR) repeat protein